MKIHKKHISWGFFIVLLVILGVAVSDLFLHVGFPITHDGQDHVARIANFYQNLQEGVVIPRWAPNLNWGYGHPILEFLYPFPSYIASLFHWFGASFIDAYKIVLAPGIVLSGITMYLWVAEMFGTVPACLAGLLYALAPYRLVDVYVRGDIGEDFAFIFLPLALYFWEKFAKTGKLFFAPLGSIAIALLIVSHNAIALISVPFLVFYAVFLIYRAKDKKYTSITLLVSFILGFLLVAFFWIPGLLEGKYTLRNIVTAGTYITRFVFFPQLLYGPWSYGQTGEFTLQLGIIQWLALIITTIGWYFWRKNPWSILILGLLIYTYAAIFLMLPISSGLYAKVMLLQNFQFPWRFLAIPVFTTAVLGAFVLSKLRYKVSVIVLIILICIISLFQKDYMHARAYRLYPESYFTGVYDSTTDTGESAPIWSVRFMEHRANAPLAGISGDIEILKSNKQATMHTYTVMTNEDTRVVENTLYFPGWQVFIDGQQVPIQFQDPKYRGLLTFMVPQGQHAIMVRFSETKLRLIADIISVTGVIVCIGWFIISAGVKSKK